MFAKIWNRFRTYHPVAQAFFLMAPVASTALIGRLLLADAKDRAMLSYYLTDEIANENTVRSFVLWEPINEEVIYRGPVWLLMLVFGVIAKKFPSGRFCKYFSLPILIVIAAISSFLWALPHIYPLTFLLYGSVLCYIILRTRSVFSLIYTMIFHMAMNALALISIWSGFNRAL